jgi:ribosomal protein S4
VNGHKTKTPSFLVKAGDEVKVKEKSRTLDVITQSLALSEQGGS